jgi:hypothetical protein
MHAVPRPFSKLGYPRLPGVPDRSFNIRISDAAVLQLPQSQEEPKQHGYLNTGNHSGLHVKALSVEFLNSRDFCARMVCRVVKQSPTF